MTNRPNSWIQFEFTPRLVALSNYTLKSDSAKGYHLLQWKIEGSVDGKTWVMRNKRRTQDLNGMSIVKSYACKAEVLPTFFRFVRIVQTRGNSSNENDLFMCNIDFFGMMESPTEL
jgi:arginine decarboxylase-like protein